MVEGEPEELEDELDELDDEELGSLEDDELLELDDELLDDEELELLEELPWSPPTQKLMWLIVGG